MMQGQYGHGHGQFGGHAHGHGPGPNMTPIPSYYNNDRESEETPENFYSRMNDFGMTNRPRNVNPQFGSNCPVPLGMFMNITQIPPRYFNHPGAGHGHGPAQHVPHMPPGRHQYQQQQRKPNHSQLQHHMDQMFPPLPQANGVHNRAPRGYTGEMASQPTNMLSQPQGFGMSQSDGVTPGSQPYATQRMTQPYGGFNSGLSQPQMMSQQDFSDDYVPEFQSQNDGMLSQPGYGQSQHKPDPFGGGNSSYSQGMQFSQPY